MLSSVITGNAAVAEAPAKISDDDLKKLAALLETGVKELKEPTKDAQKNPDDELIKKLLAMQGEAALKELKKPEDPKSDMGILKGDEAGVQALKELLAHPNVAQALAELPADLKASQAAPKDSKVPELKIDVEKDFGISAGIAEGLCAHITQKLKEEKFQGIQLTLDTKVKEKEVKTTIKAQREKEAGVLKLAFQSPAGEEKSRILFFKFNQLAGDTGTRVEISFQDTTGDKAQKFETVQSFSSLEKALEAMLKPNAKKDKPAEAKDGETEAAKAEGGDANKAEATKAEAEQTTKAESDEASKAEAEQAEASVETSAKPEAAKAKKKKEGGLWSAISGIFKSFLPSSGSTKQAISVKAS